jgi:hypothetical protein
MTARQQKGLKPFGEDWFHRQFPHPARPDVASLYETTSPPISIAPAWDCDNARIGSFSWRDYGKIGGCLHRT